MFPFQWDVIPNDPAVQYVGPYEFRILAGSYSVQGAQDGKVVIPHDLAVNLETLTAEYESGSGDTPPAVSMRLPTGQPASFNSLEDMRGCSMAVALGSDGGVNVVPYGFNRHVADTSDEPVAIGTEGDSITSGWDSISSYDITKGIGYSTGYANKIEFDVEYRTSSSTSAEVYRKEHVVVYTNDDSGTISSSLSGKIGTIYSYNASGRIKYLGSCGYYEYLRRYVYTGTGGTVYLRVKDQPSVSAASASDGYIPKSRIHDFREIYPDFPARIIGGFHCLIQAVPAEATLLPVEAFGSTPHPLAGHAAGSILPRSVWALNFSPSCPDPSAMVFTDYMNLWVDVYPDVARIEWLGGTDTTITSMKKKISHVRPSDGDPAFCLAWSELSTALANEGKRLLSHDEFYCASVGSNAKSGRSFQNDKYAGGSGLRTALDGSGNRMVSAVGCEDMCGFIWQWLSNYGSLSSTSSFTAGSSTQSFLGIDTFGRTTGLLYFLGGGSLYTPTSSSLSTNQDAIGPLCRGAVPHSSGGRTNAAPRGCCTTAYSF